MTEIRPVLHTLQAHRQMLQADSTFIESACEHMAALANHAAAHTAHVSEQLRSAELQQQVCAHVVRAQPASAKDQAPCQKILSKTTSAVLLT